MCVRLAGHHLFGVPGANVVPVLHAAPHKIDEVVHDADGLEPLVTLPCVAADAGQTTVGAQDFRFIGGSFGAASGEAFIAGVQRAIENNIPFIFFSCSGGQRMMESSIALMQMSRTALAVNELKKKNIPYDQNLRAQIGTQCCQSK